MAGKSYQPIAKTGKRVAVWTGSIGSLSSACNRCISQSAGRIIFIMNAPSPQPLAELSKQLQDALHGKTFGAIFFWRFALVRPHDQAFELLSTKFEGERLDLEFRHASGQGSPDTLSIWSPDGLEVTAVSISLRHAARLRLDNTEAWPDQSQYRIRSPRGEGAFPLGDGPALTLQF